METAAKSLEKALSSVKYITTGITSLATALVLDMLKSWNIESLLARITLGLLFMVIVLSILNVIGGRFFENSPWLRKKLFGRAYVEGAWIDISYTKKDGKIDKVVNGAIARFSYVDGAMRAKGNAFDSDGNILGTFHLLAIEYTDEIVRYAFSGHLDNSNETEMLYGYGYVEFNTRGISEPPTEYTGYYLDSGRKTQFEIKGWILTGAKAAEVLRLTNDAKGDEIRQRIADFLEGTAVPWQSDP